MDGNKFDSGTAFTFPVGSGRVIPGWDEGISSMRVGGTRKLFLPPELAYGESGAGTSIPPNAELFFEVELKGIETGINALAASVPGGLPNLILGSILLLSFIPYLLPPESR